MKRTQGAALVVVALIITAWVFVQLNPSATVQPPPIVVVFMENHSASSIIGNPNAPYLNALIPQGTLFTHYTEGDSTGPSLPDYLGFASGSRCGSADDTVTPGAFGAAKGCPTTLWNQLENAGQSWGVFMDAMPAPCSNAVTYGNQTLDTPYALKHNPAIPFASIWGDQALCKAHVLPFTSLNPQNLPAVSFVAPGICNDMHGGNGGNYANCASKSAALEKRGDTWVKQNIGPIITAGADVFITYDESGTLYAVGIGPSFTPGTTDSTPLTHYSLLAGIEDLFGLTRLNNAAAATPITFPSASPSPSVTETPSPTDTPTPTETPSPTETPPPTETPSPTETPPPNSTLWGVDAFSAPPGSIATAETDMGRSFAAQSIYSKLDKAAAFDISSAMSDGALVYLNVNSSKIKNGVKKPVCWVDISNGKNDALIDAWAQAVIASGYMDSIVVTFNHEPTVNTSAQPKCSTDNGATYVAAFDHFYQRMRSDGVTSRFAFVPVVKSYLNGTVASYVPPTGDFQVLGADIYNPFTDPSDPHYKTVSTVFSPFYAWAAANEPGMPLMIGELGENQADPGAPQWITDALAIMELNGNLLFVNWNLETGANLAGITWSPLTRNDSEQAWLAGAAEPFFGGSS